MQVSLVFEYVLWNNSLLKWLCSVQHCGYGDVLNLVWKAQWFAPSARGWGDIVWWDSLRVLGLWRQLCHVSLHPLHYTPPHTISVLRILYVYLCMYHGIGSFSAYLMFLNTWYLHLQLIIIWYSAKLSIIHHFYSVQLVKRCGCDIIFPRKYSLCDFLGHLLSLSVCVSVGRRDQRVCGGRLRDWGQRVWLEMETLSLSPAPVTISPALPSSLMWEELGYVNSWAVA